MTSLFATPLDVVKTRMQAASATSSRRAAQPASAPPSTPTMQVSGQAVRQAPRAAGTVATALTVARAEGIGALWSGLSPSLLMAVPSTVLYFTAYEVLRDHLVAQMPGIGPYAPLVAGATARTFAASIISPLELLRTKIQSMPRSATAGRSLRAVLAEDMVQQGGVRGLWRGLGPTLWRDVPFSALYWAGYEKIKAFALRHTEQPLSTAGTTAIAFAGGTISGGFAAFVTTPFDVVKTRRQAVLISADYSASASTVKSTARIVQHIFAHQGLPGLFAGVLPRVAKVSPACALMIASYEGCQALAKRWDEMA